MSSNKIMLISSDDKSFKIEEATARKMQTLVPMIEEEDGCVSKPFPIPNVTEKILTFIIEYCQTHANDVEEEDKSKQPNQEDEETKKNLVAWDASFVKKHDLDTIFEILLGANYLNIKGLIDLMAQTIADLIKDKTVEEIRVIFKIEKDFTEEEEAAVRAENLWAFE